MAQPSEAAAPTSETPAARKVPRWRRGLVALLVVLGCVVAPISVMGVWIHNTLLNTDQYVATVGPLAENPDVQNAIATRATNELTQGVNLQERLSNALPPRAAFAVPFISAQVSQVIHQVALRIVQSPKFAELWRLINRRAHGQIIALLRGQGSRIRLVRGSVILDLGPIVKNVSSALNKIGISGLNEKLSGTNRQLVLISSNTLKTAQIGSRLLDDLAIVLPLLTAGLFLGAIAISASRRRTILRSAIGLALAMALLLIVFNLLRTLYLNALPATANQAAAKAVYNQLLSFLRTSVRALFAFAVVVALAAWLAGPGRLATRIRSLSLEAIRRAPGSAVVPRDVAVVVHRLRTPLRVTVIGAALLILIALNAPGPTTVLFVAIVVLVLLAAIEVLGRVPLEASPAGGGVGAITEPVASEPSTPAVQVRTRSTRRPTAKLRVPSDSRSRHPDSFYERFAAVYTNLVDSGTAAPAKTIAQANAVPVTTVHGWAREARRRGFLAPGRPTTAQSTRR